MRRLVGQETFELLKHCRGKRLQPGHGGQRLAHVHVERRAQDARGAGVDALQSPLLVEHHHAGGEVVQDGLQVVACGVHLLHALLHGGARVRQVLRHEREGAGETGEFVARGERLFGREVAGGHLAHALGQHQQRADQLVAQQHGEQHGAENGQEQRQRERADVHAPQALARQGAFLVFAVGHLHGQCVGHQGRGQRGHHLQETGFRIEAEAGRTHQRQYLDARLVGGQRRFELAVAALVQPLDLRHHARDTNAAQLRGAGPLGRELKTRKARTAQRLARSAPENEVGHAELLAQALQRQHRR